MTTLRELLDSVRPFLPDVTTTYPHKEISPLMRPEVAEITPGVKTPDAYRLHELFPRAFKNNRRRHFMGNDFSSIGQESDWSQITEMIQSRKGRFENGDFFAPIAVFDTNRPRYMLYQLINYQFVGQEQVKYLKQGKIKVFRGIGSNEEFRHPTIDDELREDYMKYIALGFLSYTLTLAFNSMAYRGESNHINRNILDDIYRRVPFKLHLPKQLKQSFSTDEEESSGKFGPNYVSMVTPIDNLRIFSQWCGENEVYLIDPARVEDVKHHIKKK